MAGFVVDDNGRVLACRDCTVSQKDLKTMNGDPQVARSQIPDPRAAITSTSILTR